MPSPVPAPLRDATSTRRGLISITAQTFSGIKSFLDAIKLAIKTTGTLPVGGPELEGSLIYNSSTKRALIHDGTAWKPLATVLAGDDAAALAAHIISTNAHEAVSISVDGGGTGWADASMYNPLNVREGLIETVDVLASMFGANKVGAEPQGRLSGETVQAQLVELDDEKVGVSDLAATTGTTIVGGAAKSGMTWYQLSAGTLKAQLEQLLTHINTARSAITSTTDIVAPTAITPPSGWFTNLTYAKDCGGWGHVTGDVENDSGVTANAPFTIGTIPLGVRPIHEVWLQAVVLDLTKTPIGTATCIIQMDGAIKLLIGSVANSNYLALNFPSYKCA